ncbi:MAG: SUMF1/EgtB/PvdO family nonheme iron enzyme [Thermodesulfobacteriota bacterium]
MCLGTAARAQSAQDVTHLFSVTKSSPVLDRVNGVYYSYVNLTNTSGALLQGRMRLVVASSTIPVASKPAAPDGTTADGKPFYWLGEGDQTYAAGASSGNRRVNFELQRVALSYGVRVEVMAEAAALVPATGGTVEVTDPGSPLFGVKVEIPPGALTQGQVITVNPVMNPPSFADARQAAGGVVDLGPSGLSFAGPVTVQVPYDPALLAGEGDLGPNSLIVYTYHEESGVWLPVPTSGVDPVSQRVTAQVTHFSLYRVGKVAVLSTEGPMTSAYPPVLFLHGIQPSSVSGFGVSEETFGIVPAELAGEGLSVYTFDYMSWAPIELLAASLADAIAQVRAETGGWDRVHVIAHSMGGLVTRAYMQGMARRVPWLASTTVAYGDDVGKLMMIGTPNHGSQVADLCGVVPEIPEALCDLVSVLPALQQMIPGSEFLADLNLGGLPWNSSVAILYGDGIDTVDGADLAPGDAVVTSQSAKVGGEPWAASLRRFSEQELPHYYHILSDGLSWTPAVAQVSGPGHAAYLPVLAFVLDKDSDGVPDAHDACANTGIIERVDSRGCSFEQQAPRLVSPGNNAAGVESAFATFSWEPLTSRFPITYCIEVREGLGPGGSVVAEDCDLPAPGFHTSLDPGQTHSWVVWGEDGAGRVSGVSNRWSFRTGYQSTVLTSLESFSGGGHVLNLRVDGSDITNIEVREPIAGYQQVDGGTFVLTLAGAPNPGDAYTIDITHADGSQEAITWSVPAINDNFPTITDPADGVTVATATPTFTWLEAPETTWYTVKVTEITSTGETPLWITTRVAVGSAGSQSVVFNEDGMAAGELLPGAVYRLYVSGMNAAGSFATAIADFTVSAVDQPDYTDPLTGMEFVYVPPGMFQMGDTFGDGSDGERPVHTVTLTRGFYVGKYEVTQAQWQAVMGSNPSYFQPSRGYPACPTCPVEYVSWNDIQVFLTTLNAQTGRAYRLPTEAEWEYAARGGPYSQGYRYAGSNNVDEVGWHWYNRGSVYTHPVGRKLPNELGLYDMSGNVWEWVQDWWGYYSAGAQTDPTGPATGSNRVFRGGGWGSYPWGLRSAIRSYYWPDNRYYTLGLRLVLPQ